MNKEWKANETEKIHKTLKAVQLKNSTMYAYTDRVRA